jgi:hypothetical protein
VGREASQVCCYDLHSHTYRYNTPGGMFVANRDFLTTIKTIYEDGKGFRCGTSIDWAGFPKPDSGYVRAKLNMNGWYAERKSDDELQIIFVNHSNPEGWIPGFVVNAKLFEAVSMHKLGSLTVTGIFCSKTQDQY